MKNKGIGLVWIVVKDLNTAIEYYTEVLGFKLRTRDDQMGWAELVGDEGAMLGLSVDSDFSPLKPGQNGAVTITVPNLEQARSEVEKKGAHLLGDIMEVPGEVKLQTLKDKDGNLLQLVELLREM